MALNLKEVFAVLKPDLGVELAPVGPTLYQDLDANYNDFKGHSLISLHEFDSDWGTWERHPAGDEIVVLLSGSASLTLRKDSGDERTKLSHPGEFVVVPKNSWHTAHVSEPTRMLFITPGEGTENSEEI